eukprot:CAMPEP_0172667688 /NCGR_PEP_ID=MMETSP1074-20121228/8590_1 /TAXON_ID=2916 /ORGANISM="Ceratium fusus, Strain PA161109" /LENGTH=166 /DNA_ID=CAMNT_0013484241 /DNA_START=75 /DNA_END=572 /DNA_ORIENTATION=+
MACKATTAMMALTGVLLCGGISFVPGVVRPMTKDIVPQQLVAQGSAPEGSWAMGLPAVAVIGLVALSSTRKSSGLIRKTRICRQAEAEATEAPAEAEAKKAVVKKAKPVPVMGSEWKNEVNPELSHPSGLYILPVEPAEPKGSYDYDNEYNQIPSETSVHASDTKW